MVVIAVTCAYDDDKDRAMLHMGYIRRLFEAGATPIMVNMDLPSFKMPKVDGLVLSGGGDISPFIFAKKPTENTGKVQYERDVFELSVFEQCIDVPILGICRGMQLMNVAYGGTLVDHITCHDLNINDRHEVEIHKGSFLSSITRERIYRVNSLHHQSVDKLGYGLAISAKSDDGIIEAIEHEEKAHFGVQWHPEKMGDLSSKRLFDFFVSQCEQKKGNISPYKYI